MLAAPALRRRQVCVHLCPVSSGFAFSTRGDFLRRSTDRQAQIGTVSVNTGPYTLSDRRVLGTVRYSPRSAPQAWAPPIARSRMASPLGGVPALRDRILGSLGSTRRC